MKFKRSEYDDKGNIYNSRNLIGSSNHDGMQRYNYLQQ